MSKPRFKSVLEHIQDNLLYQIERNPYQNWTILRPYMIEGLRLKIRTSGESEYYKGHTIYPQFLDKDKISGPVMFMTEKMLDDMID